MKEDRQHSVDLGYAITKPDILAEVERGDEEVAAAAGPYGQHQSPRPHAALAGPSQGDWQMKEVKSEDGVSPPPCSPPARHTGPTDFLIPLRDRGCGYCGVLEPEPNPGAGNGGFIAAPPAFESRRCRPGECECGRGIGHKPDLVRHRLGRGTELGYGCGRCGRGLAEPAGLGATGSPHRPGPCPGRAPGTTEGATAAPRKERKELSLTEKVRVLEMLEGPKVSQSELAKRFGVSQPQICRIIKNKERILNEWHRNGDPERKRKREGKDAALEAALLRWVEGVRTAELPVGRPLLQLRARHLARPDPEPSGGWLARLGARHGLGGKKPPAEKGDAEQPTAEHWAGAVLPGLLRSYAPAEIFACGETAVLLPAGGPGTGESPGERLLLLLCANASGSEKVPLRAVGDSPRPRCLWGVNLEQMPWSYRAGSPAGLTAPLFAEWLREFNEGKRRQGKSVLLLLAKHEAHPYLQLSNVRMVFVPPATALAQPLDRGIASDLKGHYRRRLLRWLPAERGAGQPSLLDVLHMLAQAWGDVHPGLIASCFRAAGFTPDASAEAVSLTSAAGLLGRERLQRDGDAAEADGDEGTAEGEDAGELAAVPPCPSEREVWRSLATLRRYLECQATSPDLFQAFYELEDAVHMVSAGAGRAFLGDTRPKQ
ncbi:tigger transposable element-derived protein 3-like isoform X2 [Oenanthe melanoleuca]|uniref:tigger transposable element-derived protein 3-like isoform X2 n=1 Tax=Oenanthe melanoleuca TaxID=2939378 RepID=UPI0024C12E00|nr:tigger transposable element-derived protein 3-like isoform X2 [Oenanthe melanoleuca]